MAAAYCHHVWSSFILFLPLLCLILHLDLQHIFSLVALEILSSPICLQAASDCRSEILPSDNLILLYYAWEHFVPTTCVNPLDELETNLATKAIWVGQFPEADVPSAVGDPAWAGGLVYMISRAPFQPQPFCDAAEPYFAVYLPKSIFIYIWVRQRNKNTAKTRKNLRQVWKISWGQEKKE